MRGRLVADGFAWPIPSISGAHAYDSIPRMRIANALRRGLALSLYMIVWGFPNSHIQIIFKVLLRALEGQFQRSNYWSIPLHRVVVEKL